MTYEIFPKKLEKSVVKSDNSFLYMGEGRSLFRHKEVCMAANESKSKKVKGITHNPTPLPPPIPEGALVCSHPELGTGRCANAFTAKSGHTVWLVVWDFPTKITHSWVPSNQLVWN